LTPTTMPFGLAISTERAKALEVFTSFSMRLNRINSLAFPERYSG